MLQFTLKSMLAAVAVVALWLSSFSEYPLTSDVRKSMLLFIFLASGFAAIYNHGRRRAFWAGFFATMLLCGGLSLRQPLHRYTPDFFFATPTQFAQPMFSGGSRYVAPQPWMSPPNALGLNVTTQTKFDLILGTTITAVWMLALATMVGFAAATIHDQGRQNTESGRAAEQKS
jgi:hypothetical protein